VQALDNVGTNLVQLAEELTARDDGEAVLRSAINEVGRHSREQDIADGTARLRIANGRYNLELDLPVQDAAGRIATMLCHGRKPRYMDERWTDEFVRLAEDFLGAHDLPVPPALWHTVRRAQSLMESHNTSPADALGWLKRQVGL
jgi:hypothetical protein